MTILIKNVKIIGAEKKIDDSADIFIKGDKISALGNFSDKKADEIIDGQGMYFTPGFIDVHSDSDHYLSLFTYPSQEDFLRQGITTAIGGQCGSSLAPLLYGSLESVRKWSDIDNFNVNWRGLKEFFDFLEQKSFGINFATLIGHSTIRRAIIGDTQRNLTKNELAVFQKVLEESLEEGGFGLSTGLEYIHARATSFGELKFLGEIVKNYNGVYATHLEKAAKR